MQWMFWKKASSPHKLPQAVCMAVSSQYGLPPATIDLLRCVEQRGEYKGQPVNRVRIYDANLLTNGSGPHMTFDGLDEQPRALMFEGRLRPNGLVLGHLDDKRQPA